MDGPMDAAQRHPVVRRQFGMRGLFIIVHEPRITHTLMSYNGPQPNHADPGVMSAIGGRPGAHRRLPQ